MAETVARRTLRDGYLRDHTRNYWLHWPLKAADMLLPCSEHEATIMRAMGLTQPMTTVPLWIDTAAIRATAVSEVTEPAGRPRLLFIGQLTPRKGYDLLVRALPAVLQAHPTTVLGIVSGLNPADRAAMEQSAAELGVAHAIHFLGRVADDHLINLFRSSDLYVTPTRYEGFGLTLLEAMAGTCPVVTSDIPVVDEIIEHGVNGWLVRYNDPAALADGIIHLLAAPDLRAALVEGGQRVLHERFAETALIERIETAYRQAIDARKRPA